MKPAAVSGITSRDRHSALTVLCLYGRTAWGFMLKLPVLKQVKDLVKRGKFPML